MRRSLLRPTATAAREAVAGLFGRYPLGSDGRVEEGDNQMTDHWTVNRDDDPGRVARG